MLTTSLRLTEKLFGTLLGGLAAGAQAGNIMICFAMIVLGPTRIIGFLAQ